jgi:hypothetical protein
MVHDEDYFGGRRIFEKPPSFCCASVIESLIVAMVDVEGLPLM